MKPHDNEVLKSSRIKRVLPFAVLGFLLVLTALERARETGSVALSDPITLAVEKAGVSSPGAVMVLPLYRTLPSELTATESPALKGWLGAAFRVETLMQTLLPLESRMSNSIYIRERGPPRRRAFFRMPKPGIRPDGQAGPCLSGKKRSTCMASPGPLCSGPPRGLSRGWTG